MGNPTAFIFLDIETTGLDPERHCVIELAAVATDADFERVGAFCCLITAPPIESWDPWCQEQHTRSGLVDELASRGHQFASRVAPNFCFWLSLLTDQGIPKPQLAGSSLQFDLSFLLNQDSVFKGMSRHVSHRHLDISTMRTMAQLVGIDRNLGVEKRRETVPHRAQQDVELDIKHAKIFKAAFEEYGDVLKASGRDGSL